MSNGFYGGGVSGDAFIGRKEYLAVLNAALVSPVNKHISLFGLPHIGKTSILMEWGRQAEQNRNVVFLFSTISLSGYSIDIKTMVRELLKKAMNLGGDADRVRNLVQELKSINNSSEQITDLLEEVIGFIGSMGYKTVLCLDEFEHISKWTEEEYMLFASLLMRRTLNLLCVVASRPHISYILADYERQASPFKPLLVKSFCEEDMDCAVQKITDARNRATNQGKLGTSYLQELLSVCGRNPFLLMKYVSFMNTLYASKPKEVFRNKYNEFQQYFTDIVNFMLYEEEKNKKSFSHIVKCYLGFLDDYKDIIDTYIDLGYIETIPATSKYAHHDDRYQIELANHTKQYYTTVCAAFVNYLYMNKLDLIKDTRDVLTGFVHTIRDITRTELDCLFAGSNKGWNEELLLRMRGRKVESNGSVTYLYAYKYHDWHRNKDIWKSAQMSNTHFPVARANWINANQDQFFEVGTASLQFVTKAFTDGVNPVSPSIDPISVRDNGAIFLHYWNVFAPYFGVLNYPGGGTYDSKMQAHMDKISETRNHLQHFARFDISQAQKDDCKKRCIYLLKSIYSYWGDGIVAAGTPF